MIDREEDLALVVRHVAETLRLGRRLRQHDRLTVPRAASGVPATVDDDVEADELFTSVLVSVATALRNLGPSGVSLDLSEKPLVFRLVGEIVGVTPETREVRLRLGGEVTGANE